LKHCALFVIGHSPAILTETLAAYIVNPADDIRICTTASGAKILKRVLLEEGGWQRFQQMYPVYQDVHFDASCLIVPENLEDIRSPDENQRMAQVILEMVQDAVRTSSMISASIAGGRKTMGYLLGFAMTLFARPQDRMTHVLVPPEWERDRKFLFPEPEDARRITLVDIPFIRLKGYMKPAIYKMDVDTLVASAQTAVDIVALEPITLQMKRRTICYLGLEMTLPAREFAFYLFFSRQKLHACADKKRSICGDCCDCFLSIDGMDAKREELLAARGLFGGIDSAHYERFEKIWTDTRAAQDNLAEPLRRISQAIESVFGMDPRAERLHIRNIGKRGSPAYGLFADKTQIRIERG